MNRGEECEVGFIESRIHMPREEFDVEKLNKQLKRDKARVVVFHCWYSQNRGPKSARKFFRYAKTQSSRPLVLILKGGWARWARESKK